MKRWLLFVFSLVVVITSAANAQVWRDEKQIAGQSNNYGSCVAFDREGNRYVAGVTRGRSEFSDNTLYGGAVWCAYVAKYAQSGELLWVQAPGVCMDSVSDIYINSIAADAKGNLFIAGKYLGSASFFGSAHTSTGASEIYLAKLTNNGALAWLKTAGGIGHGPFGQFSANAISLDDAGNCYVTGSYNTAVTFDTITISAFPTTMLFIAKYDSDGHVLWAKSGGSTSMISAGRGIATRPDGTSTFTGTFFGNLTIGSFTLDAGDAEQKIFVAKCDATGNILWAHEIGRGGYYGTANDIAIDQAGNSYVAASFDGTIDLGSDHYTYNNQKRYILLVSKYDSDGRYVWATTTAGSDQASTAKKIIVDPKGDTYLTGSCQFSTTFGSNTIQKSSGPVAFVAQLDPTGKFVSTVHVEGVGSNVGNSIALANTGDIALVGEFHDTIVFAQTRMISAGGSDVFVVVLEHSSMRVLDGGSKPSLIRYFPNPATHKIFSSQPSEMKLTDILGRNVRTCVDCDRIETEDIPAGIYFIGGTRVIVQH